MIYLLSDFSIVWNKLLPSSDFYPQFRIPQSFFEPLNQLLLTNRLTTKRRKTNVFWLQFFHLIVEMDFLILRPDFAIKINWKWPFSPAYFYEKRDLYMLYPKLKSYTPRLHFPKLFSPFFSPPPPSLANFQKILTLY